MGIPLHTHALTYSRERDMDIYTHACTRAALHIRAVLQGNSRSQCKVRKLAEEITEVLLPCVGMQASLLSCQGVPLVLPLRRSHYTERDEGL